jgi:hypothetical protein
MSASDLFLAILSMDSYNRSGSQTPAELVLPSGSAIGSATVSQVDDIGGDSFFAVVYSLQSGQTVISYRGTDDKSLAADPSTGWVIAGGAYNSPQAVDAATLYKQVNGGPGSNSNIILTGDSLGGGLAGFIGDIYSDEAVIFNNMPFELAVARLYADPSYSNFYFGNNPVASSEAKIHGYAVDGEILQILRAAQSAPVTTLSPGMVFPSQSGYQLHDIATLIVLLDAQQTSDTNWTPVA